MNSFNHYSLGSVGQWLYEEVAGIRAAAPGYACVTIAPVPGDLESARATYESVRGRITSAWRRDGDTFALDVEIPANVTATVVMPPGAGTLTEAASPRRRPPACTPCAAPATPGPPRSAPGATRSRCRRDV
jgi:alpha-L-rhamnosidase-like protein